MMNFIAMVIAGYKLLALLFVAFIGVLSVAAPLGLAMSEESAAPLLLYLITPLIVSGCIKILQLL